MTAPRLVLPGQTYLITRRCTQRQFLLTPSILTNQIVRYCLALVAQQTQVEIHAVCFMSNHWHGIVSDPFARLPEFLELFHKLVAKAMNVSLGRWENFWSSDKTSVVHLVSSHDIVDTWAYVIANPTAAGLVKSPELWPGVITRKLGEPVRVAMPGVYFNPEGALPEEVTLHCTRPPIFAGLSDRELGQRLQSAVDERVRQAHARMRASGRSFLGAAQIVRQSVTATPDTAEPRGNPHPHIAARNTSERVYAIRQRLSFLERYREAWQAWRTGLRDTLFPPGTYALRVFAGVSVAPT